MSDTRSRSIHTIAQRPGRFVPPVGPGERSLFGGAIAPLPPPNVPDLTPQHRAVAESHDDAMTQARATLVVAGAYMVALGLITVGLLLLAWLFRALGPSFGAYAYGGLLIWGVACLVALARNRRQGLDHSPAGVARREIEARERVALAALEYHYRVLMAQLERREP